MPRDVGKPAAPSQAEPASNSRRVLGRSVLRLLLSSGEYQWLRQSAVKRLPALESEMPSPAVYASSAADSGDSPMSAVRASLRVFAVSQAGFSLYDTVIALFARRRQPPGAHGPIKLAHAHNARRSLALALLLLLHRLLHRFFRRLRASLRSPDAAPFRKRNARAAQVLTSRLSPAVGAGLAGIAFSVFPGDQLRLTLAIYAATRSAEFAYDALDEAGRLPRRPAWWGSWLLMPFAFGQLLHAFVFDRDCFPEAYGKFILGYTPNYLQRRPIEYPRDLPWPTTDQIVDSLAEMSRLKYPPFSSPILFPDLKDSLPSSIASIAPVTSSAHPSIKNLSCAVLHPQEPSCLKSYITFNLKAFPGLAKFFTVILALFQLPKYRAYLKEPTKQIGGFLSVIVRMTTFITGAIGTSWAGICLFQSIFPRTFLPTQRWFLGGFMAGFWAFLEREGGHSQSFYSFRLSLDSLWKVGVKRKWWKAHGSGDVLVIVASLMILNTIHEVSPSAIKSRLIKKGLQFAKGDAQQLSSTKEEQNALGSSTNDEDKKL